jgi:flagellar export protein FliJ
MPPKFSLQSILDYHHQRVEILELELSRLMHSRQTALEMMQKLMEEQERLIEELSIFQSGEMDLHSMAQSRLNLKRNQAKIKKQKDEIDLIDQAIETKRQEVIQAKQDEAVFEKLREKELERYFEKVNLQEKSLQTDIYISQAHRQTLKSDETEDSKR